MNTVLPVSSAPAWRRELLAGICLFAAWSAEAALIEPRTAASGDPASAPCAVVPVSVAPASVTPVRAD